MRVFAALTATLVVGNAIAAPTPSLTSSILGLLTKNISALLSSLGIKIHTDGSSHGTPLNYHNKCPFSVPAVTTSNDRFSHDIQWSKGVSGSSFVNWRTFKANGANLGGWLEKRRPMTLSGGIL